MVDASIGQQYLDQAGMSIASVGWTLGAPAEVTVVPGVPGRQIVLLGFIIGSRSAGGTAVTIEFRSNSTAISGQFNLYEFGFPAVDGDPEGVLFCEVGEDLRANLDGNGGGTIAYAIV
jgi:hypothetical protein